MGSVPRPEGPDLGPIPRMWRARASQRAAHTAATTPSTSASDSTTEVCAPSPTCDGITRTPESASMGEALPFSSPSGARCRSREAAPARGCTCTATGRRRRRPSGCYPPHHPPLPDPLTHPVAGAWQARDAQPQPRPQTKARARGNTTRGVVAQRTVTLPTLPSSSSSVPSPELAQRKADHAKAVLYAHRLPNNATRLRRYPPCPPAHHPSIRRLSRSSCPVGMACNGMV